MEDNVKSKRQVHCRMFKRVSLVVLLVFGSIWCTHASVQEIFDTVILGGRLMDPESNLDAVRNIGVSGGKIKLISTQEMHGRQTIDARGLVVAPGFIDMHEHGQDLYNQTFKARDGVTSALDLEGGTFDIDNWYAAHEHKALINYGTSINYSAARIAAFDGSAAADSFVGPAVQGNAAHSGATGQQVAESMKIVEHGLDRGAPAIGLGIAYIPGASHEEVLELFRVASKYATTVHVHMRFTGAREPDSVVDSLDEVLADAMMTGAPLHVVHISGMALGQSELGLRMISDARAHGVDVTTEAYPYTAAMTDLASAVFDPGWQQMFGIDYKDLQWTATGERLNAESFAEYRKTGGLVVIHAIAEHTVRAVLANPLTMIASDGILRNGTGHPRGAGCYARVLGYYVREEHVLTLMEALRRMTIMPAQRLETHVPTMKNKGRIRVGADADITIFDADKVIDRATFENPAVPSAGIPYVLVKGVQVVRDGNVVDGVAPGEGIRAPIHPTHSTPSHR
jgi:N-acyl-D-aspartate/D-glutamate deacylase